MGVVSEGRPWVQKLSLVGIDLIDMVTTVLSPFA